jgi:hypothetical protein
MRKRVVWLAGLLLSAAAIHLHAELIQANPGNYRAELANLKAGDLLQLAPGDYYRGLPLHNLAGEAGKPIVISGPVPPGRAVFHARADANTVSLLNAAYIEIRNLELDGDNLPVDGVRAEGHAQFAHHITLAHLLIVGHGNNQQTVGISTKCPAWGWVIRDNVIRAAGTGMYLGNSDGSDPFIGGVIEYNLITDTLGYNLQIKHQIGRPDVPGIPTAPQQTVIRYNVFSKAENSSGDGLARPNVLVGHAPLSGHGVDDRYLVYGNFFYRNPTEALFQGEGNIAFYNNLLLNPDGDALHIQPHHDQPKRIWIAYNTILASGDGVRILTRANSPANLREVTHNLIFAGRPLAGGTQFDNQVGSKNQAAAWLRRPDAAPPLLDLSPLKPLYATATTLPDLPDITQDYSGRPRNAADIGALTSAAPLRREPLALISRIPPR